MNDTLKELLAQYNIFDDITTLKGTTEYLKIKTNELNDSISTATSLNTVSSLPTYHDLDQIHYNISKIFNEITNINTQLDELYSDIQYIKDVLNI